MYKVQGEEEILCEFRKTHINHVSTMLSYQTVHLSLENEFFVTF